MTWGRAALLSWFMMALAFGCLSFAGHVYADRQQVLLDDDEIAKITNHGPWPPQQRSGPGNQVSGNPAAIQLGRALFFDARLSSNAQIACSSCHNPTLGWTDGKAKAGGLARLDRNTQSLFNVGGNRWFGWDGRNDNLWAQSLGPILDEREMGATPGHVVALVRGDENLRALYRQVFDRGPETRAALDVVVDISKALAAFQETIVSERTAFDAFRDALAAQDYKKAAAYPKAAQRGAALFVGRGKCNLCHIGPRFTNDEFDDAGMPYFTGPGQVDAGRFSGIKALKASPYTLLGEYSDAAGQAGAWATRQVVQTHRTFGQFRVPSLRQLRHTAPYMHNGSLATIRDVVDHYSAIDLDRMHSDGALILRPLKLTEQERQDLAAFLETL